ncbi:MAG TPA: hypothetical protein ENN06_09950 [Desulfobacteraceae bacterium]|nr:hypothetical protein [Desulfobacteraceae bacterium]
MPNLRRFFFQEPSPEYSGNHFADQRKFTILSMVIFMAALFIRSWENILHPSLYMEDAGHYFNVYYGGTRSFSYAVFHHPNGYFNILNNIVAWAVAMLDVRLHPILYQVFSLTMGIATALGFLFTGLIRNRFMILAAPIVLGLSGMNHIFYYNSLTFQMYNVVILLLLIILATTTRSKVNPILYPVSALLIWSGPYSVVALPISILLIFLFRNLQRSLFYIWIIVVVAMYSLSVRENTIQINNIFNERFRSWATEVFTDRILFLDLLDKVSTIHIALLFLSIFSALYILRKDSFYIKISIIIAAVITGSLAPFFLSIKSILYGTVFPCHIYISQFFWLAFILFTVDRLFEKFRPHVFLQAGVLTAFLLLVVTDNIRHPEKGQIDILPAIPAFVQTIHLVEELGLDERNQYVILRTDNLKPPFLSPTVRVGSLSKDARRLERKDLDLPSGSKFIVE